MKFSISKKKSCSLNFTCLEKKIRKIWKIEKLRDFFFEVMEKELSDQNYPYSEDDDDDNDDDDYDVLTLARFPAIVSVVTEPGYNKKVHLDGRKHAKYETVRTAVSCHTSQ